MTDISKLLSTQLGAAFFNSLHVGKAADPQSPRQPAGHWDLGNKFTGGTDHQLFAQTQLHTLPKA